MTDITPTPLETAQLIATRFLEHFQPHTVRVIPAGSLRRLKPQGVKDLELVYIPTPTTAGFFERSKQSGLITPHIYTDGTGRWGDKFKGFMFEGLRIEAFAADDWNWGTTLTIRTGPAAANTDLMIATRASNYRFKDGYLWYATDWEQRKDKSWASETKRRVKVSEEQTLFDLMGIGYVYPWERTDALYKGKKLFQTVPDESMMAEPQMVQRGMF